MDNKIIKMYSKLNYLSIKQLHNGKNTLPVNGAKLFNSLGNKFKNVLNYSEFKAKLKTRYDEECLCNNCTCCRLMLL